MKLPILTPCHDGMYHGPYVMGLAQALASPHFMGYMPTAGESHIDRARSTLACKALEHFPAATHFLWVDADIGFTRAHFDRIASLPADLHIVGGVYVKKGGDYAPVFRGPMGEEYPADRDVVEVRGVGTGFCRMSREVLEAIAAYRRTTSGGWKNIFHSGFAEGSNEWLSEDYMFCEEAAQMHYKTYLDRAIRLTHRGFMEFQA